jgi:DNA-binding NtrC family response regulator
MVKTILLVDDANDFLNSLTELLRTHGYFVSEHSSPREALESCRLNEEVTAQLTEVEVTVADGSSVPAEVRRIYPTVEELLLTGNIRWWGPPSSDDIDAIENSVSCDELLRALENQLVS